VQQAAEQVFKNRGSFEGRSELATWVYAICYRVLLKQRRWYRRWSTRFRLELDDDPIPQSDSLPSVDLERRERLQQLQVALQHLSERHRAVVILHDLEELSVAEISSIVACNELTVRSRLRDARKKLRVLLHDEHPTVLKGHRELSTH
jgi:RNA polymerase sigma-70 factor (ECF subfamily)